MTVTFDLVELQCEFPGKKVPLLDPAFGQVCRRIPNIRKQGRNAQFNCLLPWRGIGWTLKP
jgi:hypothetical protein